MHNKNQKFSNEVNAFKTLVSFIFLNMLITTLNEEYKTFNNLGDTKRFFQL